MLVKQRAEREQMYWFPVAMGVATKAEIDQADLPDLQFYNEVAYQKYLLTHGGGGDDV